ncbi:uncharacterized protein Dana_GF21996 [Drosophila ananassae]|uniref:Uncharacterized protein n=1 Tax=Drosophila ananassae TaxID=7217 RepID=B3MYN8_DROAN|nr:uncharacterized protein LOC6504666 [Drosophila ananassae]EDV32732.2 uncharacterized protein Dana_GF21996 [Drosophila ananassae]
MNNLPKNYTRQELLDFIRENAINVQKEHTLLHTNQETIDLNLAKNNLARIEQLREQLQETKNALLDIIFSMKLSPAAVEEELDVAEQVCDILVDVTKTPLNIPYIGTGNAQDVTSLDPEGLEDSDGEIKEQEDNYYP